MCTLNTIAGFLRFGDSACGSAFNTGVVAVGSNTDLLLVPNCNAGTVAMRLFATTLNVNIG